MNPTIVGADGCKGGWLCLTTADDSAIAGFIAADFSSLLDTLPAGAILAIDIPIGLPEVGARRCDLEARKQLGPRASSVFPAPLRALLAAPDYRAACAAREAIEGKRVSKQAFGIFGRIGEVDAVLGRGRPHCEVRECHPELSFARWAGAPMRQSKKTAAGRAERARLIDALWPGARARVAAQLPRGRYAVDDLHDAFAALWTARRLRTGRAAVLPANPEADRNGLRMEIVT